MCPLKNDEEYIRLEPSNKSISISDGIEARIKDPLFMISRQWQLGEFIGFNGGNPVRVETKYFETGFDKIHLGKEPENSQNLIAYDSNKPMELLVEEEDNNGISKAWDSKNLEYNFHIKGGQTELIAEEYDGNNLDWYHFNISNADNLNNTLSRESTSITKPSHIKYSGMPSPRWWKIEDSKINIGDIKRPYLNFLTSILMEIALMDSNDWYIFPLIQKVGTIKKINSINVTDSFGVITKINPVINKNDNQQKWQMFTLTNKDKQISEDGKLLFVPNNLHYSLESEPLEKISFLKDEMANLVWAIEHNYEKEGVIYNRNDELKLTCTICGDEFDDESNLDNHIAGIHGPDNRLYLNTNIIEIDIIKHKDYKNMEASEKEKYIGPLMQYQQKSYVPQNWIPYFPIVKSDNSKEELMLRRGRTNINSNHQYKGKLLEKSIYISEESVPKIGLMVLRNYQLARGNDGSLYSWKGKYKLIDEKRKSSGLKFDILLS